MSVVWVVGPTDTNPDIASQVWEVPSDALDVLHHGNHHPPFSKEIKDHTKVVVDLPSVGGHSHSVLLAQPFSEDRDLIGIAV
jgi:hypothetical protein